MFCLLWREQGDTERPGSWRDISAAVLSLGGVCWEWGWSVPSRATSPT